MSASGGERPLVSEHDRPDGVPAGRHMCDGATRRRGRSTSAWVDCCRACFAARLRVTGGSCGIGLAIARALVAEGVRVTATGRGGAHRHRRAAISQRAGAVETLRGARRAEDVQHAIEATVARFGGLDIVINNAGIGIFTDVASMTTPQWTEVIETNLTGVFNVCHAALPHLRQRGGGFIINISSLAGKNPFADGAAYCASKAGLNAFSEALMQEVRHDNIRVSYVMPGSVATGSSAVTRRKAPTGKLPRKRSPKLCQPAAPQPAEPSQPRRAAAPKPPKK